MARPKSKLSWGQMIEIWKTIVAVVLDLGGSDEDLERLLTDKERVREIGKIIVQGPATEQPAEFFTPIRDVDVPPQFQATLAKYRTLAPKWGVATTAPVCYHVKAGFTIREHAPKAGPCVEDFQYLKNWSFTDEPTADALVFWIPRLVPNSASKSVDEQKTVLAELRQQMELPEHHLSSFGSAALLAGLILAHYKATGERTPLDGYWTRTDTRLAGGGRLRLSWHGGRLSCAGWHWGEGRGDDLGVIALGVELGK